MVAAVTPLAALVAAFLLTGLVRRHALSANLLDVPDARRSHDQPTPRGGGLAVVAAVLGALPTLWWSDCLSGSGLATLGLGGAAVAAVGWTDDHRGVPARWRLLVHFLAIVGVLGLVGWPAFPLPGGESWDGGWLAGTAFAIGSVWLLNLYNFMDGIDGLAGTEAVTVTGLATLLLLAGGEAEWALVTGMVGSAALGFLLWNWPPAKIFMGDGGSGFLGFILAALALLTGAVGALPFWVWLILLGVFIVDATLTLLRRALRGQPVYQAHRSHAYQFAARHFGGHRPVTLAVGVINIIWLGPLAGMAAAFPGWGIWLTAIAWTPLLLLGLHFHAGQAE